MKHLVRKPAAGNPHIRFDERDLETGPQVLPRQISTLQLRLKCWRIQAAIWVDGSNFGEVGTGQCKRLLKSGFRWE